MRAWIAFGRDLTRGWTWNMAWRESRRQRRRLLLCAMSIVMGVAALIAVGSLSQNLQESIDTQAKTLLGADLAVSSRDAFSPEEEAWLAGLGGEQAREISLSSMVYFPKSQGTRLAQVRALRGGFPFYGTLETEPAQASAEFRAGGSVLVEESLLQQFGVEVGDTMRLGELSLRVGGRLRKVPGEMPALAAFAPRVYIAIDDLTRTGLLRKGSLVRHRAYFKFHPDVDVPRLVRALRPALEQFHCEVDTVERRKRSLGRAMTNLTHFLSLAALVALLLGGIGVASAIHLHVKQKRATVAILRSLGCSANRSFSIYLAQALALALSGVVAGAALGRGVQLLLPIVLADLVPFPFPSTWFWPALWRGAAVGLSVCLIFALLPLLNLRRVSPWAALRLEVARERARVDPAVIVSYLVIVAGAVALTVSQSPSWEQGMALAAGAGIAFALLAGVSKTIVWGVRRHVARVGPFTWRQGLASLHRPGNRTVVMTLGLGLGTFLILTLYLVQTNLTSQILPGTGPGQADAVLFDIQPDQVDAVSQRLRAQGFPVLQNVPVVTMRLAEVRGQSVERWRRDPRRPIPGWALRREYRSTYRDHLVDSEKLLRGEWHERVTPGQGRVPVSVEEGIAHSLGVTLGDELVFDVQGVSLRAVVANLREVDWRRLQPNFFVVFPRGVLEDAPAFHVLVTRVGSSAKSAAMQRDVIQHFPNVSCIDFTLVIRTLDAILDKVAFVVRFMALFTVGTGVLVVFTMLWAGRVQRLQESILLRTLGASRRQVLQIMAVEYASLGVVSALVGILLAWVASWVLATFVFKIGFRLPILPLMATVGLVATITLFVGLLTSRGICSHPPLEVLRAEG